MGKKAKTALIIAIAVIVVLFIIIMLIPDDEEDALDDRPRDEAEVSVETEESGPDIRPDQNSVSIQGNGAGPSTADVSAVSVETDAKSATVMIYVNGSDLESEGGEASNDIAEMLKSGVGNNVNVIIQTMGTKEWQDYGISSKTSQTYRIKNGSIELIRDGLGQLDCTSKDTLSEFIGYCGENFPADRYMLLFWNHGGGPVYGFGYDEWQDENESLTLAEISAALAEHGDIRFDMIGMDCCIMASMETLYAFAPYCRYALLSEDFESGMGWSYTGWMGEFEKYPGISTPLLGKYIVDDIIRDNENESGGDSACISLFNTATSGSLYSAWKDYAYRNESALMKKNYSRSHKAKGRSFFWDLWGFDESDVTLSDYYISDILALVESIDSDSTEAKNLMSALKAAVVYYGHTSDKNELTGLAVSLPYGDPDFYDQLKSVYTDIGLDSDYIDWLGGFTDVDGFDDYYDYGSFEDSWGGWGTYEDDYGCNISNGSCEYGYDYDSDDYGYYADDESDDDWIYDYDEELWYRYEDDVLYLYDDESETLFYYDEDDEEVYYYDEDSDDWFLAE